ncbi:MAG: rhomboid family intramembrane serine protease [Pseudomonadota bacterium]
MIPLHDDNPTELKPVVTGLFLATSILAFVYQLSLGTAEDRFIYAFGVIPAVIFEHTGLSPAVAAVPEWLTPFTSMFLHGGWGHLLGNMLYLWIFGNNVEDALGHVRFFFFYFICGVGAVFAHAMLDTYSLIPLIGASGAISGILGAYLLLFPHARVLVAVPLGFAIRTLHLPTRAILVLWFALQVLNSLFAPEGQAGVAWTAHVGGFLLGLVLVIFMRRPGIPLWAPRRPDDFY